MTAMPMNQPPSQPRITILHLSASPQGEQGASHELSSHVVARLLARHPGAEVRLRMLAEGPGLAHVDADYARALANKTADPGSDGSLGWSEQLIDELTQADLIVIGTPMHNLTVPSTLKAWIDHVVRINRTMLSTPKGKIGTLAERPVYLAISSGGWRTGERARQPDFIEPYLRTVLAMMGLTSVTVFSLEGTSIAGEQDAARSRAWASVDGHFANGTTST